MREYISTERLILKARTIAKIPNCVVGAPMTLELADRLEAYEVIIEKYAMHYPTCDLPQARVEARNYMYRCTCGLDEAMEKAGYEEKS